MTKRREKSKTRSSDQGAGADFPWPCTDDSYPKARLARIAEIRKRDYDRYMASESLQEEERELLDYLALFPKQK